MSLVHTPMEDTTLIVSLISSHCTLVTGYVASASFLERVCNLVKEVRDQNPSVKFGMY